MCVSMPRCARSLLSRRRPSEPLILPVRRSGNACANSEGYVAPGGSCHSRTRLKAPFRASVNTQSLPEALVMSIKGCWMARPFASRDYGFMPKIIHRWLGRCAISPKYFSLLAPLTNQIGVLPRGCHVETLDAPKHRSSPGRHTCASPARFGLDAWGGPKGIHHQTPRHRPAQPCGCPSSLMPNCPYGLLSYPVSPTASITSTLAIWSMGISRGYVVV